MKDIRELIWVDPERMGGVPCFRGTRVPVATVFENLAHGVTLEEIFADWPTLNRDDVVALLRLAGERVVEDALASCAS